MITHGNVGENINSHEAFKEEKRMEKKQGFLRKFLAVMIAVFSLTLLSPEVATQLGTMQTVQAAVKINSKKITLTKGQKKTLKLKGTKKKAKWSSSKKSVATVSSKGVVFGKKKGTTVITAKVGSKKYTCKVTVETPKLNKKSVTLSVGKSSTLKVTGTKQKVKWTSSNIAIAAVTRNGKVVAKSAGTADVIANVGGVKYICKVNVKGSQKPAPKPTEAPKPTAINKPITGVSLDRDNVILEIGKSYTLNASILPVDTTADKTLVWTSSNPMIAAISNGTITALKEGNAIISVSAGNKSANCKVIVTPIDVKEISFASSETTIRKGQNCQLTVVFQPINATLTKKITWETSNSDVAIVQDGTVYGKGVGTCTISAKYGDLVASCNIIVDNDKETLRKNAEEEYNKKVKDTNESTDKIISECNLTIFKLEKEGYYTETDSQYNSEVRSLSNEIRNLQRQSAALATSTDSASKARKARIDSQIETKQAQMDSLQARHTNTVLIRGQKDLINEMNASRKELLAKYYEEYQKQLEEIENLY